jgi:hypothetical protein
MSFALSLVPLAMAVGLLTPVVGPALDHHYTDRSPVHAHIFAGEGTNIHEHTLASHDHLAGDAVGDGVSIISTSASSAHGPLTLDGATLESAIPNYDHYIVALQIEHLPTIDERAIAPLDRPPRRA